MTFTNNSVEDAFTLLTRHAESWRALWQMGEGLKESPRDEFFHHGAVAIVLCKMIEAKGGFFIRRSARKVRTKIERALIESGHLRETAQRLEDATGYLETWFKPPADPSRYHVEL